jgi:lipopolysaccharide export system protein LptA
MKNLRTSLKLAALSSALSFLPSALALAAPTPAPSAPAPSAGATLNDPGIYTISGQNLTWNQRDGNFTIPSDVKFTQPGTDVTGDHATGNSISKSVKITGHVVLHNAKPVSTVGITTKTASSEPQTLTSDELDVDGPAKTYVAIGNVKFTQGSKVVTAERGTLDQLKHLLTLNGNLRYGERNRNRDRQAGRAVPDSRARTICTGGNAESDEAPEAEITRSRSSVMQLSRSARASGPHRVRRWLHGCVRARSTSTLGKSI